jgi:hypothetical protein
MRQCQLLILCRRFCFFPGFVNDLSDFAREFRYPFANCFWREALLMGFVRDAVTHALRDDFATLEQFLSFLFGRLDQLIGLLSEQFILTTSAPRAAKPIPTARGYSSMAFSNCFALEWYPLSMLPPILRAVDRPS